MMSPAHYIELKRPFVSGESLVLIGAGGVGKSTLGREIARQSGWPMIDLDLTFCDRIQDITAYIAVHGYDAYRAANLGLAKDLLASIAQPTIFVTSSGFMAAPPDSDDYRGALALVRSGYSITLLPSLDLAEATDIVVARQLTRGLGFEWESEAAKFQRRFPMYRPLGDMLVVSTAPAEETAAAVVSRLLSD